MNIFEQMKKLEEYTKDSFRLREQDHEAIMDKIQDDEYKYGEQRIPEEYDEETDKLDELEEKHNPQRK